MKRIHIVAAIIFNPHKSQIFITKRPDNLHKGGFWEFLGGKVEPGETAQQALIRELDEEVAIQTTELSHFQYLTYDYPEKSLKFDFFTVTAFEGQPYGREGQEGRWVDVAELTQYQFPEANVPVLEKVMAEFCR